ncbi:hypothetical protein ACG97_07090 [Vogesella sp. EB]|jgi:hypothetical protein|uniref:Uncharacterized protein DUF3460 n=2 Tax=Vogesella TaxID=57739 RepID=A0A495BG19_VOGIN|nr:MULTISPECIES: DUF3460 family protein [Vogesella]KMJ53754.1 hypothetical protein ACG97_07090 [Vogesella sp. EB]MCQ4144063.1 DUF3460 family protein [Vogesella sp. AC12]MDC7696948.1 DUF3460 family protein [Vogesella indigofera]MDC7701027.1 DUF3460 family protein [Vogesella indigofera]MDC7703117.1 DUF3460 family protein [Vogesella indigofera]
MYQSEFTQFMNDFLAKNPQVESERRELRLTWWDRKLDLEDLRRWNASKVPQKPYVYQPD